MRTDSTTLAKVADRRRPRTGARPSTAQQYLPAEPRVYKSKVKNAQEAHEAIRPAGHPFELPAALRGRLDAGRVQAVRDDLEAHDRQPDGRLRANAGSPISDRGRRGHLPSQRQRPSNLTGFSAGLRRGLATIPEAELADKEVVLPSVAVRASWRCVETGDEEPHHAAPGALQRSRADRGAGRAGHRPAEHLRLDHRDDPGPQLRVQEGRRPGADLGGVLASSGSWRTTWPTWSTTSSPPRWRICWTPSAAAKPAMSTTCEQFYFGDGSPGLREKLQRGAGGSRPAGNEPLRNRHTCIGRIHRSLSFSGLGSTDHSWSREGARPAFRRICRQRI